MKRKILTIIFVVAFVTVMFAALAHAQVGDGKTDDTVTLQNLLDSRADFSTLKLRSGATYRITSNLNRDRAIHIESTVIGKPAILRYDYDPNHSPPFGRSHLNLSPRLGPPRVWKETLSAGQRPNMAPPLDSKKHYLVSYGTARSDPYDINEKEQTDFADDGVYPAPARDIRGDVHFICELLSSTDGSAIRDIRFECGPDSGLDYALGIYRSRGILISNLSADCPTFIQLVDSQAITMARIRARVYPVDGHTASNRLLAAGMCRDVILTDADVDASDKAAHFMFENWCDGISIDRLHVHRRSEADKVIWPPCAPVFFSNGGTKNFLIRTCRIDGDLYAWDCGGQPDQQAPTFNLVELQGRSVEVSNVKIPNLIKLPSPAATDGN